MELKEVFTLVLLSLAAASYAKKSRSSRTLWLDENGSTSTKTDKNIDLFDQVHEGDHEIKRPFFAKRPHGQKVNQSKVISDEGRKITQNFVKHSDDFIKKKYAHQEEILDRKDNQNNLEDIRQILSDILEETVEEYLKNYCATTYNTDDYRICLLFCNLSHQSNAKDGKFPPPFPQNTHSVTSEDDSLTKLQQIQHVKGSSLDQKHIKSEIDKIADNDSSNVKNLPNLTKHIPQLNYVALKRSKRWTQALSNLMPNTNISGVSNRMAGIASNYIDPYYIMQGTAVANGLTFAQLNNIAYVTDTNAQGRTAAIVARPNSGYSGQVVVRF